VSTAVIIPARGGSKGIMRKNLHPVGGVPLVERAIKTACAANPYVKHAPFKVCVSSDDDEILELAKKHDAYPFPRAADLCGDDVSTEAVLLDVLKCFSDCTHVILMQCTSPFTQPADIRHVHERLQRGAECVVTVTPWYGIPWTLADDGVALQPVLGIDGVNPRKRRQDRQALYLETGALYGMRVDLLRATGSRFCGKPEAVMMPKYRSPEIDDGWDLDMADRMAGWPGCPTPWRAA
jgi:CMP-N-acetylneuraminic acid synthetase